LHIGNKQNGFAIHSRVNVIPEGKDIAEEPYDARVSSTVLRERRGESPLRYSIIGRFYVCFQNNTK
jgi:hypothetical protein